MIFVGQTAFCQKTTAFISIDKAFFTAAKKQNSGWIKKSEVINNNILPLFSLNQSAPYSIISSNFYTQHFGFFCKKELQIEKIIKVPFKFRLGSVQQCDWMEGKPNTGIR